MDTHFVNDDDFLQQGITISTDNKLLDFDVIYQFLEHESYWSKGIAPDTLRKAISNSLCFGIYHQHQLCAFARVVTDRATFGYVCDVFVLTSYRGRGLSKWLVQNITRHPELTNLRRWSLATADAHSLYRQYGFEPLAKPYRWMEIFKPYKPAAGE